MLSPPLFPEVADSAPDDPELTAYDHEHLATYLRHLDADAENADWREVACIILGIDAELEPDRTRRVYETILPAPNG
jgi:hypothetical protein